MNTLSIHTKVALGVAAAVVIAAVGYLVFKPMPAAAPAATPPVGSEPTVTQGAPIVTQTTVQFDPRSMTTTSAYPVITGTANVATFELTIVRADGRGLARSTIPVIGGRWSFSSPLSLTPGIYGVVIVANGATATGKLTVKSP